MSDNNNKDRNKFDSKIPTGPNRIAVIAVILAFILIVYILYQNGDNKKEINYNNFLEIIKNSDTNKVGKEKPLLIDDAGKISGMYQNKSGEKVEFTTTKPLNLFDNGELYTMLTEQQINFRGEVDADPFLQLFLFNVVPILILVFMIWFMFRQFQGNGNKAFTFGKSKAKKFDKKDKVTFKDVAGVEESKYELQEVIEFLKDPAKFTRIGAKIPKGVLLVGPPGTGKTLLSRAVAGEAGVNFFYMSGSDFVEMFVGVGASRVRDLFDQGRKHAPCILFIDELDAVGRTRGAGYGGGHDEREQTLNQLLVEMDGFDAAKGVILIAATNRPDVLDPALLRPGRFDRQIVVDKPDVKGREQIFEIHTKKIQLSKNVNLQKLARATPGFSGADIANMVNEAALYAARYNKKKVTMGDFEEARDKVMMGVARKSRVIPPKDKLITSYHEAGHTIINLFVENADDLHKVTIIPRGMAAGLTWSLPSEEQHVSKSKIIDEICMCMGGRVAEEVQFNEVCTGAVQDIKHATDLARRMVTQWGMSEDLGLVNYGQDDSPIFLGKEIATHKDYSEKTAQLIDEEIKKIIDEQHNRARKILTEHKEELTKLAETLCDKETMDAEEVYELLGLQPKNEVVKLADDNNNINEEETEEETEEDKNDESSSSSKPDSGEDE